MLISSAISVTFRLLLIFISNISVLIKEICNLFMATTRNLINNGSHYVRGAYRTLYLEHECSHPETWQRCAAFRQ